MRQLLAAVLVLGFVLALPLQLRADSEITVDAVIEWLHKGVEQYWIQRHLKEHNAVFHLTPKDVKDLSDAGASTDLIEFMLKTGGDARTEEPKPPAQNPPEPKPPTPPPVVRQPSDPQPVVRDIGKPKVPRPPDKYAHPDPLPPPPPPPTAEGSSSTPAGFIHYHGAFDIDYPRGWKVTTIRGGKNALTPRYFEVGFVPDGEPEDLDKAEQYFEVAFARRHWKGEPPSLDSEDAKYRESLQRTNLRLTPSHAAEVNGRAALTMFLTGTPRGATKPYKVDLYMVIAPEGMYSIAFGATIDKREAVADFHKRMFNSFRWGNPDELTADAGSLANPNEEAGKDLVPFTEPDHRFRLKYPSPWNEVSHVDGKPGAAWLTYYFGRAKYDPSSGAPFSFGVKVMVQKTLDPSLATTERLAAFANEIAAQFVDNQKKSGSLPTVLGTEPMAFAGLAAVRINYDLIYQDSQEEVGYLVIAATREATFIVEANAPKASFNRFQSVLKGILDSFEVLGHVADVHAAPAPPPGAETQETARGDPAEAFTKWRDAMSQRDVEMLWELRSSRLKSDMEKKAETARRMVNTATPSEREQILADLGLSGEKIGALDGRDFFCHLFDRKYPAEVVGAVSSLSVKGRPDVHEDHAVLTVLRKDMGTGTVDLVYEDGAWRIDTDY